MILLIAFILQGLTAARCIDDIGNENFTHTPNGKQNNSSVSFGEGIEVTDHTKHMLIPDQINIPSEYIDHLKQTGGAILKNISMQSIKIDKVSNNNITFILNNLINDYMDEINKHCIYINEQKPEDELDKQLFYLDLVETSSKLIFSKEKYLINFITSNLNYTIHENATYILDERIHVDSNKHKKEEIQYLCATYNVCRHYPAFSDHFADFITEALNLPDKKFKEFVNITIKIIKNDLNKSFETMFEKDDNELTEEKFMAFSEDLSRIRVVFDYIKTQIKNRFKFIYSIDNESKIKIRVIRKFIDAIDKNLSSENDNFIKDVDNAVHNLRGRTGGLRMFDNFQNSFKTFLNKLQKEVVKVAEKKVVQIVKNIVTGLGKDKGKGNKKDHKKGAKP